MVSPFFLAKAKLSVAKLSVVIPLLSIVPVMLHVFSVIPVDRVNAVDSVFPVDPGCICFFYGLLSFAALFICSSIVLRINPFSHTVSPVYSTG
jgi:hypothetical protein